MPILTLNQIRLVLRLALAHGQEVDRDRGDRARRRRRCGLRLPGDRAASCSTSCPFAGWAVKGAIAYAGTRAIGEAAQYATSSASGRTIRPVQVLRSVHLEWR